MKPKFIYNSGKSWEPPVEVVGRYVEVVWRDGKTCILTHKAENYFWEHCGGYSDIISYRIIGDNS